jgi:hypothetical protein
VAQTTYIARFIRKSFFKNQSVSLSRPGGSLDSNLRIGQYVLNSSQYGLQAAGFFGARK